MCNSSDEGQSLKALIKYKKILKKKSSLLKFSKRNRSVQQSEFDKSNEYLPN